jgi:hypothetical protein
MRTATVCLLGLAISGWVGIQAIPIPPRTDAVLDWNVTCFDVATAAGQNAIIASRAAAMVHIAIHDALNTIDRRYEPYVHEARAYPGADPEAAIAAAAHDVLVALIPGFDKPEKRRQAEEVLEKAYRAALEKIPEGAAKDCGIEVGECAASSILRLRRSDKHDAPLVAFAPSTMPGAWRTYPNPVPPNPPVDDPKRAAGHLPAIMPQWAEVTPFTLAAAWQFRCPGPPAIGSEAFARDYEEVKRVGAKDGSSRTPEQSDIARFWYDGSPQQWSRIACVVARERGLDPWEEARLLALVNMAIADAFIAGLREKYRFGFWRPVTAIRAGDDDGNDATTPDPAWEPFLNTPAHPDYPATHSACGAAGAAACAAFFGSDDVAFTIASGPPFSGMTRSFTSFSQASRETDDSRVFAGVHFRFACSDGAKLGRQIGRRAAAQFLLPSHRNQ